MIASLAHPEDNRFSFGEYYYVDVNLNTDTFKNLTEKLENTVVKDPNTHERVLLKEFLLKNGFAIMKYKVMGSLKGQKIYRVDDLSTLRQAGVNNRHFILADIDESEDIKEPDVDY